MSKLITVICLFVALSTVHSQSCSATNSLRSQYGFANTVGSAVPASGINYCKSLKNSSVCCTASDMNSIADKSADILKNLTNMVKTRDLYTQNVKDNVLPQMQASMKTFSTNFQQIGVLLAATPGFNMSMLDELDMDNVLDTTGDILTASAAQLKSNWTDHQKTRSSCITEMVKLQNAAYCSACDPSATSKGYSQNTGFTLSTRVCNRLKGSCKSYFEGAGQQNGLIQLSYGASAFTLMNQALTGLMTGDTTAFDQFESADSDTAYANRWVAPADTPEGCDGEGSCDWICDGLFTGGMIDQTALVVGGVFNETRQQYNFTQRRLQELAKSDNFGGRMLSGNDFDPDSDEAGVTVTFAEDPASTNGDSSSSNNKSKFESLSLGNVFISMMVVISSILLL